MTCAPQQIPILLVDDNPEDYRTLKRCFTQLGLSNPLLYCSEGQEALDFLNASQNQENKAASRLKPGCILLDLNMPTMDGKDVLRSIKSTPQTKHIPVIMLSSSDRPEDVQDCYREGAKAYLKKPQNFEGLMEAIQSFRTFWLENIEQP